MGAEGWRKLFKYERTRHELFRTMFQNSDALSGVGASGWATIVPPPGSGLPGFRVVSKGGAVPGFFSELTLVPSAQLGVTLLLNYFDPAYNTLLINAHTVIDLLLPALQAHFAATAASTTAYPAPANASAFVGAYQQLAPGGHVVGNASVSLVPAATGGAQLVFAQDGQTGVLEFVAPPGVFVYHDLQTNQQPCLQRELGALDLARVAIDGDQLVWGDPYSQPPYRKVKAG